MPCLLVAIFEEKGKVLVCARCTRAHAVTAAHTDMPPRSRCVPRLKVLKLLLREQTELHCVSLLGGGRSRVFFPVGFQIEGASVDGLR